MKLLIDDTPLQVLPSLAKAIGLNEAIFLQQLHYWLNKSTHTFENRRWIYNTASSWSEQFPFWSEKTIRRTIDNLREKKLIQTTRQFNKRAYDKTNWFTINYQNVKNLECQIELEPSGQSVHSVAKASGQSDHIDVDNLSTPIPVEYTIEKRRQPKKPAASRNKQPLSDHAWFTRWWCFVCQSITGEKYIYKKKDSGQVKQLLKQTGDLPILISRTCVYFSMPDKKRFPPGITIGGLSYQIAQICDADSDLIDRFIDNKYLPVPGTIALKEFQPWKEANVTATAS